MNIENAIWNLSCPDCGWEGTFEDCLMEDGDEGLLLCPKCETPILAEDYSIPEDECRDCEGTGNLSIHGLDPYICSSCNGTGKINDPS